MKRFVTAGLVAIAAGAGLLLGLAWLAARSLVMPVRRPLPRTPAELDLVFESLDLAGADGIRLASWWIPADRPRATAVLVHGFRATRNELLDHAPYLHTAGLDVVLYDARACGQSGGTLSTMGWREQADLRAVIDQVWSRTGGLPVVVLGHSLGAATAILEGADDARVIALVLEAPFTAIDDVVGRSFRHFTRPHLPAFPFAPLVVRLAEARVGQHRRVVRPIDVIDRLAPRPVLLVSGRHDAFVTPADAHRLADRAGSTCTWWLIEEAGHPGGEHDPFKTVPDEYQRRVVDLVDRALASLSVASGPQSAAPDRTSEAPAPQSAAPPPTTGSSVA